MTTTAKKTLKQRKNKNIQQQNNIITTKTIATIKKTE